MSIQYNVPLKSYNTFRLSATAKHFYIYQDVHDIEKISAYLTDHPTLTPLILGGGSNIIFIHDVVDQLVILNQMRGIHKHNEDAHTIKITVGAGENWHDFVTTCVKNSWYGLENLALIPGTVGAAPVQNIGAYGVEVGEFIISINAYDLLQRTWVKFNQADCQFGYRHSLFKQYPQRYLISEVTFSLLKHFTPRLTYQSLAELKNRPSLDAVTVMQTVMTIRRKKLPDPDVLPNVGSFFHNPTISTAQFKDLSHQYPDWVCFTQNAQSCKISAAQLIERAGLKGYRLDTAGISEQHALVLVNYGDSSGHLIETLMNHIITIVRQRFNIVLTPEPLIVK